MDFILFLFLFHSNYRESDKPAEVLGILPCKPITFKKRVRKVIIELN